MPTQNSKQNNILEERKRQIEFAKKRVRLLIIIGVLFASLFAIVFYASVKNGGISNLIKGDKNIISNTIDNIGTSFTGNNQGATPTISPVPTLVIPTTTQTEEQITTSRNQNFITFEENESQYNLTIKKGTYVIFRNEMVMNVVLRFNDGRTVRLREGEDTNLYFDKAGSFTFENIFDTTQDKARGTIRVVS